MNELDRWAHQFGYSDFDTFVRAGGSFAEAMRDIHQRILALQDALKALAELPIPRRHDDPDDEPPDPDNAQIQGADHP